MRGRVPQDELRIAGVGSSDHLAGEMLRTMAEIDIVHVPYKGDEPAEADLLGGQIQMMFTSLAPVEQHLKSGRLKALGVSSSRTFSLLPDLPTVASGGDPDFEASLWNGNRRPVGDAGERRRPSAFGDRARTRPT